MCGLIVSVEGQSVGKVRGDTSHALSRGYSCPKGRAIGELHHDERRLNIPLVRSASELVNESWPAVIDDIADRILTTISANGPDSVAMYLASGSAFDTAGRRAAERFLSLLGSQQKYTATTIDTPSKPLVAELVGGWSGLTPVWDEGSSKLLVLFGSNPVVSHGHSNAMPDPVRRIREFQDGGGELWVVDPRRTETALLADHHIHCAPGSDWLVLGWLVRRLLLEHPAAQTLDDRASDADALRAYVEPFTDELLSLRTDVSLTQLENLLSSIVATGRVSALTGTGISMSATANITEYLLWSLHIVTDSYDMPGGMWFNPGFLMQLDQRKLPTSEGDAQPGPRSRPSLPRRFGEYPCAALIPEIEAGNVTTLIVVGGNPITAFPDSDRTARALKSLSTLVVIDILPTETTALATHVLPAVDQLERADLTWLLDSYQLAVAAQFTEAVVKPRAERKPMWWMFGSLSERLDLPLLPSDVSIEDATDETFLRPIIDRSRNGDLLRSSSTAIVDSGPVFEWVSGSVLPDGKWRLHAGVLAEQFTRHLNELSVEQSAVLIPHRRLRMMNSQFRSLDDASNEVPVTTIHASPTLVEELGSPDYATISTASGSVTAVLISDDRLHSGCITLAHGIGEANVCELTSADDGVDELSGMVLQSGIEVTITPAG